MALRGTTRVPGDKSISHRALLIGALAEGPVRITGLGDGQDNSASARVIEQLGVRVERTAEATIVHGVGLHGLQAPDAPLDCGNSGTTMRLLIGILAGQPFEVTLIGDESLSRRPMKRVLEPLAKMGLTLLDAKDGTYPPLRIRGQRPLKPLHYDSPIASAQVKSALLLAGLWAPEPTVVTEPAPSRDHTERMLQYLGHPPQGQPIHVPGDLSSAAFLLGAALMEPGSQIEIKDVGINPTRTGVLDALEAMGANLHIGSKRLMGGEPIADLRIETRKLRGTEIKGDLTVRAIDELPLIATVASVANGTTRVRDAQELRVKESDRIAKTAELLSSFGIPIESHEDGWTIHGDPDRALKPGAIDAHGDHRIAMCAALLDRLVPGDSKLKGMSSITSSFPGFFQVLDELTQSAD